MSRATSLFLFLLAACSASDDGGLGPDDGVGPGPGAPGSPSNGGGAPAGGGTVFLPPAVDGGSAAPATPTNCGLWTMVLRDFRDTHPDMEKFLGLGPTRGLVGKTLGGDGLPVYAPAGPTGQSSGKAGFDEWYRDVPGVNMRFEKQVQLTQVRPGVFVFEDKAFFPLDGQGFGNEGRRHNYHFTTVIRGTFTYKGGEKFKFSGDDDVFVFVNGRLALDLGGVHPPTSETIEFDKQRQALGLVPGGTYSLDVFHAERRTSESNFRIETSIPCFRTIIE